MNGKQAKRLRFMQRDDKRSKRKFMLLSHIEKGKLTALIMDHTKLGPIPYLDRF